LADLGVVDIVCRVCASIQPCEEASDEGRVIFWRFDVRGFEFLPSIGERSSEGRDLDKNVLVAFEDVRSALNRAVREFARSKEPEQSVSWSQKWEE
jgi:hypothetical protein